MLTLKHLSFHEQRDARLGETLKQIETAINQLSNTAGIDPTGVYPTPNTIRSINVTASAGWFDVTLNDPNPQRGVQYFVEWDTQPGFPAPRTKQLGTSRTFYEQLGNLTLYWRGYSQFLGSNPSPYVVFGAPTAVVGGGASGPVPQPSQGSGAGQSAGANPTPPAGRGYGKFGL